MAHIDGDCCATEYANDVKEGRKGQDPLRFRQSPREDCLQHDAADQADESKGLSDTDEQFRSIEVLSRPRCAVLRAQPGSERGTSEADREEHSGVMLA